MADLRVLSVASELYPLVKTGGLADVIGALPTALAAEGVAVRTLLPGYPPVLAAIGGDARELHRWTDLAGGPARLLAGTAAGLDLLVLDAGHLFARAGNPYLAADGRDWQDNAQRFAALARVGAMLARGLLSDYVPDVLHAHDWQAALAPAYLALTPQARPATVLTVHNLAFQGLFPPGLLRTLALPAHAFATDGVEFHDQIGFLKAGLRYADRITTVSPSYAEEIRTPAGGMGLDGLLRGRADRLRGILNGIDTEVWNPARDPHIAATFDAATLDVRAANKGAVQARLGLAMSAGAPLFGVISRLTEQKGLDLLVQTLPVLLQMGAQLAVLGTGSPSLEAAFRDAAAANPGRVGCLIGYDEALAHQMQAGVDALLVPSRFEPCGLTQLCALRYGAVPVVARVGGLADTVIDANPMAVAAGVATGIVFAPVDAPALTAALRRAVTLFADRASWRTMQSRGMATDVSWTGPAGQYAALYRELVGS